MRAFAWDRRATMNTAVLMAVMVTMAAMAHASSSCVSYLRTRDHPFFPLVVDRTTCAASYDAAMATLERRVQATCAMRPLSNLDALAAAPRVDTLMPLTTIALLGMPLLVGFAELARPSNSTTSAPYVAFVTLACVLHLCVISALYAQPLSPTDAYKHCCTGMRVVLRQPLCDGGSVIARIAPVSNVARGVRAVGAFLAAVWTVCAACVVRRYSVQKASEYGPLLAKWRR